MNIHLVALGERMPPWVQAGFAEYARRLPSDWRLVLREVRPLRRTKGADMARVVRDESERLLAAVTAAAYAIALDRQGRELATEALAAELRRCRDQSLDMAFLVGGPEGLSAECLARVRDTWSMSRLTFAHPLVRVVFAEQLYRAWSITAGRPYHR